MLLDLDFELLRLIFLHLKVRDLINLYETCSRFNRFFLLETGRSDSIVSQIKLKNLVAVGLVENALGGLKIAIYNNTFLSSRVLPDMIRFSEETANQIQHLICSKDHYGCKTRLAHGDDFYYDEDIVYIQPHRDVLTFQMIAVTLSMDATLFRRLLQEYEMSLKSPHSERPITYVFGDRSVLRTCRYRLLGQ